MKSSARSPAALAVGLANFSVSGPSPVQAADPLTRPAAIASGETIATFQAP